MKKTKIVQGKEMLVETITRKDGTSYEQYYLMKVRYKGKSNPICFINGKEYYVVRKEPLMEGLYGIIDETDEDYLYSLDNFDIIESV